MVTTVLCSDVRPLKSDDTIPAAASPGYTLIAATTYYYELGSPDTVAQVAWDYGRGDRSQALLAIQILLDADIIITSIELEDSLVPAALTTSSVANEWIKENPPSAYVACVGNCSASALVISKTTGAVGGAMVHVGNTGALRQRLKVVVGATGGVARVLTSGKS